ncbi:hypothetical protein EOPP23_20125 [Endozoicomonas sp. OPT23]|uniref:DUF1853 family protein n=1 Tax=Endozoicomonas sp. OPT23 TaxID=2072845 RepID=UPI00129BEA88|nr:DUF1853 family protein [Endozoicomonas sp. OPT23]MRI35281.1 hypothetical protein [Endozoicomonas sp. OPT23]
MLTFDQIARDIHWIQSSPALLSQQHNPLFIETPNLIKASDRSEYQLTRSGFSTLIELLGQRRQHLLGIYYETLWQFVLSHGHNSELIATNLQVKQGNRTLGEFDLILRQQNQIIHRELAIKYYLGLPSSNEIPSTWNHWVGPGLKDRLDRKLNRLIDHQINLSQTEEGKTALGDITSEVIRQEILVQGYLFYPFDQPCNTPVGVSDNHLRGQWLPASKLPSYIDTLPESSVYQELPKQLWLSPFAGQEDCNIQFDEQQLVAHLQAQMQSGTAPKLIARCRIQGGRIIEEQRFIVVPDDWQKNAVITSQKQLF